MAVSFFSLLKPAKITQKSNATFIKYLAIRTFRQTNISKLSYSIIEAPTTEPTLRNGVKNTNWIDSAFEKAPDVHANSVDDRGDLVEDCNIHSNTVELCIHSFCAPPITGKMSPILILEH